MSLFGLYGGGKGVVVGVRCRVSSGTGEGGAARSVSFTELNAALLVITQRAKHTAVETRFVLAEGAHQSADASGGGLGGLVTMSGVKG